MSVMHRPRRKEWPTDLFWSTFLQSIGILCCLIEIFILKFIYIFLTIKLLFDSNTSYCFIVHALLSQHFSCLLGGVGWEET